MAVPLSVKSLCLKHRLFCECCIFLIGAWHKYFIRFCMRFLFLVLIIFFISCDNTAKPPLLTEDSAQPDGTELNDTTPVVLPDTTTAHSAKAQPVPIATTKLPEGFYRAQLPCPECPKSLEHTVYFRRNKTYWMEETSLDDPATITQTSGSFNPSGGTIWAYKGQIVKARYRWGGDTLYYLLPNNKRIAMQELTAATENDAYSKKKKKGLAFFAVGNEPFWNLEIRQNEQLAFHLAEWKEPLQFTNASLITKNDSLVYSATSDSSSLVAIIYNRFCSDGMSDYTYTHSIRVIYNGKTFMGCGIRY